MGQPTQQNPQQSSSRRGRYFSAEVERGAQRKILGLAPEYTIKQSERAMEAKRGNVTARDFTEESNLGEFFEIINAMPLYNIPNRKTQEILRIARKREELSVRPKPAAGGRLPPVY